MDLSLPPLVLDVVIDVSHYQGMIDWPAVASVGIALAFVKATEGSGRVDPMFSRNLAEAEKAGIVVVPYHFIAGDNAETEARHLLATAGTRHLMMLDWESPTAPQSALVEIGAAVLEATGRAPICYYGASWLKEPDQTLSGWPLMLPAYPRGNTHGDYTSLVSAAPRLPAGRPATRPYDFHQYTPAGNVMGIIGSVDRSVWVGTRSELDDFVRAGTQPSSGQLVEPRLPDHPLFLHCHGPEVEILQQLLRSQGYAIVVDGDFGSATQRLVRAFQRARGLSPDGMVGPLTRAALQP